jgi:uncharacterized protein involved in exopolysaccharide biosynthesis
MDDSTVDFIRQLIDTQNELRRSYLELREQLASLTTEVRENGHTITQLRAALLAAHQELRGYRMAHPQ